MVAEPEAASAVDPLPASMRAIRMHTYGGPGALVAESVARPEARDGHVRIAVSAAGVNPADARIRSGQFRFFAGSLPRGLGTDLCGRVVADAHGFQAGERVVAMLSMFEGEACAEEVLVPVELLARAPEGVGDAALGALPMAGLTAWQGLVRHLAIASGESVLICGASGGVGHLAVQIARSRGARVTAVCSAANAGWVASLGAERVVAYDGAEAVPDGFDVVFDVHGGLGRRGARRHLRPGGRALTLTPTPLGFAIEWLAGWLPLRPAVRQMLVEPDADDLVALLALVESGDVRPHVGARFPLERVADAHALLESSVRGKIVLSLGEEG